MEIESFEEIHILGALKLSDKIFGPGYYSKEELAEIYYQSLSGGQNASKVLLDGDEVKGVRLSFPPGRWQVGKGGKIAPAQWPHPQKDTGYFQTVFLASEVREQGWARKLSLASIETLKKTGAKGVATHSWVESPGDGSRQYLNKMGFKAVATHPNYWFEIDYICTRCGKPCVCTAEEMYLDLENEG